MSLCESESNLFEYVEGEYGGDISLLEKHLQTCEECRNTVEEYRTVTSSVVNYYSSINTRNTESILEHTAERLTNHSIHIKRYAALAAVVVLSFLYALFNPDFDSGYSNFGTIRSAKNLDYSEWNFEVTLIEQEVQLMKEQIPKFYQ